jgi:quercetin dioxygenase-like cupin family protein
LVSRIQTSGGSTKMAGKFILENETQRQPVDWGRLGWICGPTHTGAAQLAIVEGSLIPGKGHNFHKHPGQEEVMFVVSGRIEQWIDKEKRILGPGDSAFIPPGVVHATFKAGENEGQGHGDLRPLPRRWVRNDRHG